VPHPVTERDARVPEGLSRDQLTAQLEAAAAEAKIRAAELRYRTLVEQIPAITFVAMLGDGKNEIYVSPHIEAVLGFPQREWLANPFLWYTQLHPDDRALWIAEFARGCRSRRGARRHLLGG
jgi:PAS domain-containing protein